MRRISVCAFALACFSIQAAQAQAQVPTGSLSALLLGNGIARSGANVDITSLSGLLTPLSIAQGGTGGNSQAGAQSALGLGSIATHPTTDFLSTLGGSVAGNVKIVGGGALDTTYTTGGLTNGILTSGAGNLISYCPVLSCLTSPTADHQRTSALFWGTTALDGIAEEQTVAIETIIGTGAYKTWAPSTAYAVGTNIVFAAANTVYRATTAGTSASSGTGPTGTGSAITDGTVVWQWINASAIDGKVGLYEEASIQAGAGNAWGGARNVVLQSGATPLFDINTELDFANNSGTNCYPGPAGSGICNALYMHVGGSNQVTSAVDIAPTVTGSGYAAAYGLHFEAGKLASISTIQDDTTSLAGYTNTGTHSSGDFVLSDASPFVISTGGSHSAEVLGDTSTSPAALALGGTYSLAAIYTAGASTSYALYMADNQRICWSATTACFVHLSGKLYYQIAGVSKMSIADSTGNVIFSGTVTPSGTP